MTRKVENYIAQENSLIGERTAKSYMGKMTTKHEVLNTTLMLQGNCFQIPELQSQDF